MNEGAVAGSVEAIRQGSGLLALQNKANAAAEGVDPDPDRQPDAVLDAPPIPFPGTRVPKSPAAPDSGAPGSLPSGSSAAVPLDAAVPTKVKLKFRGQPIELEQDHVERLVADAQDLADQKERLAEQFEAVRTLNKVASWAAQAPPHKQAAIRALMEEAGQSVPDDEPVSEEIDLQPARRDPKIEELQQTVRELKAERDERLQRARYESDMKTLEREMSTQAAFQDEAIRELATPTILSHLAANPTADRHTVIAFYAAKYGPLLARRDGSPLPSAVASAPAVPSTGRQPFTGKDLESGATGRWFTEQLAKLTGNRRR